MQGGREGGCLPPTRRVVILTAPALGAGCRSARSRIAGRGVTTCSHACMRPGLARLCVRSTAWEDERYEAVNELLSEDLDLEWRLEVLEKKVGAPRPGPARAMHACMSCRCMTVHAIISWGCTLLQSALQLAL